MPGRIDWRLLPRMAAVVIASVALLLVASPAYAHPWGPPPTAVITVDGSEVVIQWQAEIDDAAALLVSLGLLHPTASEWDWGAINAADRAAIDRALGEADALHAYLLENIQVRQGGAPCEGAVPAAEAFLSRGARVLYTCPEEIEAVSVRITMLHSVHEAYRTFGHVPGEAVQSQHVFTSAQPEHLWSFGRPVSAAGGGFSSWRWPGTVTPVVVLLIGAVAVALRRRGPSKRT